MADIWGRPEDLNVHGNRPADVQGNTEGRNVYGNEPRDIFGNPESRNRSSNSESYSSSSDNAQPRSLLGAILSIFD